MGEEAPPCIWLAGDVMRLEGPQVAVVGSRETPPPLFAAARRLARGLADGGWVITSGLARGADTAAFLGGSAGASGTLAVPACGLNRLPMPTARSAPGRATFLALAPPDHGFNAGLAIRRNAVIAALADALILVASDWKGGSWHAVGRALRERTPVLCLECGGQTPDANAWLLERGLGVALPSGASADEALGLIASVAGRKGRARNAGPRVEPLDFFC